MEVDKLLSRALHSIHFLRDALRLEIINAKEKLALQRVTLSS